MKEGELDLGSDVTLRFTGLYEVEPPEDFPHFGAIVAFHDLDEPCEGSIMFDHELTRGKSFGSANFWTVESWDPLTLSPSIQCRTHPHHHGFVQQGRWVQA